MFSVKFKFWVWVVGDFIRNSEILALVVFLGKMEQLEPICLRN